MSGPLPHGTGWRYEPKWDGHRALVWSGPGAVRIASSTGRPREEAWAWLETPLRASCPDDVVLDGEVIALGDDGRHRFQLVGRAGSPHAFVAFDLLAKDGEDLTGRPWRERRLLLERLVRPGPQVLVTPTSADGDLLAEVTRAQGYEGVIAKQIDSLYLPGRRSSSWVKTKHRSEQEFVVGGFLAGTGRRARLGSLLLGVYDDDGVLRFAGAAGSGLGDRTVDELLVVLEGLRSERCPFEPRPAVDGSRTSWVHPEVVVQVGFTEWTTDGRLRHPVVLGVRDDVDVQAVRREPG